MQSYNSISFSFGPGALIFISRYSADFKGAKIFDLIDGFERVINESEHQPRIWMFFFCSSYNKFILRSHFRIEIPRIKTIVWKHRPIAGKNQSSHALCYGLHCAIGFRFATSDYELFFVFYYGFGQRCFRITISSMVRFVNELKLSSTAKKTVTGCHSTGKPLGDIRLRSYSICSLFLRRFITSPAWCRFRLQAFYSHARYWQNSKMKQNHTIKS